MIEISKNTLTAFFCLGAGIFTLGSSFMDWDFFMNNRKARIFVKLFGRNGARVFYSLLGLAFVALSIAFLFDLIE